uniref:NADH dehydrogenase [ubiquinone] iron-sulfur protein 3, mitochondrial n=1 Tax=Hirondellea gigas TaxID=1518452 RepID=A0A2P2IBN9_9CRUS
MFSPLRRRALTVFRHKSVGSRLPRAFARQFAAPESKQQQEHAPIPEPKLTRGQLLNANWGSTIIACVPKLVQRVEVLHGEVFVYTTPEHLIPLLQFFKSYSGSQYQVLCDMCCVDYIGEEKRFEVWYILKSLTLNSYVKVLVRVDEMTPLPTATHLWASADWAERETYDMFGVFFTGHPDLRRILTDYGFKGHPLRKDFPLSGYTEVRYDDTEKRMVTEPIEITQEFRNWKFVNPWHEQQMRNQEAKAAADK